MRAKNGEQPKRERYNNKGRKRKARVRFQQRDAMASCIGLCMYLGRLWTLCSVVLGTRTQHAEVGGSLLVIYEMIASV